MQPIDKILGHRQTILASADRLFWRAYRTASKFDVSDWFRATEGDPFEKLTFRREVYRAFCDAIFSFCQGLHTIADAIVDVVLFH